MTARILVVDDDPHVREVLRRMLTRDGYSVSTASDGVAALDAIASQPPDLVILDITMPRMDGFSVCRTIKANPATALIPVTMLTGRHSEEERRAGIEAGTDDFLAKPFDSAPSLPTRLVRWAGGPRQSPHGPGGVPALGGAGAL